MDMSKTSLEGRKMSREDPGLSFSGVRNYTSQRMMENRPKIEERGRQLHNGRGFQRDKPMEDPRRIQDPRWKESDIMFQGHHRGERQVSLYDHENLVKKYDQMCTTVRMYKLDKEQMETRLRQEIETRYIDQIKSLKQTLEDQESDRDSLRYQLSDKKRDLERLHEQMACLSPSQENYKREITRILQERDQLRTRLEETKKDKMILQDKLVNVNQLLEASNGDAPVDHQVNELRIQVSALQHQNQLLQKEVESVSDLNKQLRRNLEITEVQLREAEDDRYRLNQLVTELRAASPSRQTRRTMFHGNSDDMLAIKRSRSSTTVIKSKSSQGSVDDNINLSDNPNSLTDLTSLSRADSSQTPLSGGHDVTLPGYSKRRSLGKFSSSSTSNLTGDSQGGGNSRLADHNSRLRVKMTRGEKAMDDLRKEKQLLVEKVNKMEGESEAKLRGLSMDLEKTREDLVKAESDLKTAKEQINLLTREKGVAMRDNAASYEQSIQKESRLRELQTEKEILEQQRDIANQERERVITELVGLKKKLEAIKMQRQKDAKELTAMRHLKGKAVHEVGSLRKQVDDLQQSKDSLKEELTDVQDSVERMMIKLSPRQRQKSSEVASEGSGGLAKDLRNIAEQLLLLESERKTIFRKLFCTDITDLSLNDALRKIDSLYHERDDLVLEIKALQQSSSKLNEERIYDLKQRVEDLLMEQDTLNSRNTNLKREASMMSSKLVRAEQDRDRYAIEVERIQLQCEQLKNTQARLVEEHTRTLERVNELWKQKWPVHWDEAWEEKQVTISLDTGGFAGFSVVGGCDQPQLPNPGAFIVTTVNQGGPADGFLKVGDILDSVNGINLTNADHREAVRAVKETKKSLSIVLKRRRNAHPIQMGIVSSVNAVPQVAPSPAHANGNTESLEYSLYVTGKEKSDLGFKYDWTTVCTVTDVASSGPATQILEPGDKIIKINNTPINREKSSNIKKLLKPHKNILRLDIERVLKQDRSYMGQALSTESWPTKPLPLETWEKSDLATPTKSNRQEDENEPFTQQSTVHTHTLTHIHTLTHTHTGQVSEMVPEQEKSTSSAVGYSRKQSLTHYKQRSRDSYSSREYSEDTESESQDSGNKPTRLVSLVTAVKMKDEGQNDSHRHKAVRPISDGVIYGDHNERRIEYEEILLSEQTGSQYSQSESYLSESSSFDYGLSSSQSIDLTFHSYPNMPSHNRLTVDTVMTTQARSPHSDDENGVGFMARDDASRTTFRNRNPDCSNTNSNNSEVADSEASQFTESQVTESELTYPDSSMSQEFVRGKTTVIRKRRRGYHSRHKKHSLNGSSTLSKLSTSDQNLARNGNVNLAMRGRSRSNLSLSHAPSMTKLVEEPRRSTSTTNVTEYKQDPLADAIYIRANFSYIPRTVKELGIKTGDVFHIHDEASPERFRASFWVSRLSSVGTDEGVGAIPNSIRAQEYLDAQGEAIDPDLALYEEVEAFTGRRPVLVFGALCDQVVNSLLESYPKLFYSCPTDFVEGAARITEARLGREVSEGKLIDFRRKEGGYELYRVDAISVPKSKSKHCLMVGSIQALHTLKAVAPPITIIVKAMTPESINTFSLEQLPPEQAKAMFDDVSLLKDNHNHEFSASLFLIYMDTLMGQIEDIVTKEKRKQGWVPIARES